MLSNNQREKYLSKLKKLKFEKINECKNLLYILLHEDLTKTIDYIKSSLFFKCIGKNLEQITILKEYYTFLHQLAKKEDFPSLVNYLKSIKIVFKLYEKFNKKLKHLSTIMSIYLYRSDYEIVIKNLFDYMAILYFKNDNMLNDSTIDYVKYAFRYLDNKPLKTIRRVNVLSIFNALQLLSRIENLEYLQLLFGAKIQKRFDGLLLRVNKERAIFEMSNRRKIIKIEYERSNILNKINNMDLYQMVDQLDIYNTIAMMKSNSIKEYIDFYNIFNPKILNMIDKDVVFESIRLGMKANDFLNIEIFKTVRVKEIVKVFSFFYFYASEISTQNIGQRITSLLRKKADFLTFLTQLLKISRTKAIEIFDLLSAKSESYIDASYTPILVINDILYFNAKVLSSNNISRNLVCMLYKSSCSTFNNSNREEFMLKYLEELFQQCFPPKMIYKNIKYKYMKDNIKYEGDIDLVLEYEADIYFFECKSILNIVEYYEYMRVADQLKKAETQLDKIKNYITNYCHTNKKIHFAVISTTKLLMGNKFISYPVVSFEDIYDFLENKKIILPNYYIKLDTINNDNFNQLIYDYWYEKLIYNDKLYVVKTIGVLFNEEQLFFNYFKYNHICKKQKNFVKYSNYKTNFLLNVIYALKFLFVKRIKF